MKKLLTLIVISFTLYGLSNNTHSLFQAYADQNTPHNQAITHAFKKPTKRYSSSRFWQGH